jgi:hypothetical protein
MARLIDGGAGRLTRRSLPTRARSSQVASRWEAGSAAVAAAATPSTRKASALSVAG